MLVSSPSCHLSIAEQILSYMGIHWQLLVYLVLWTILPQEIQPITPVGDAFWHQVLYERSLLICSPGQLMHSQDCSVYTKQIVAFTGRFCTINHSKHCFLAAREDVQHSHSLLPLPHLDILPVAELGESAALTKTEEHLTRECMCHTHSSIPSLPDILNRE